MKLWKVLETLFKLNQFLYKCFKVSIIHIFIILFISIIKY